MSQRWSVEQVESVAPSAAAITAAQPLATPARWVGLGAGDAVLWGSCQGSGAEPYDTMVDHVHPGFACTCPSRKTPCKHALALLLLWVRGQVADTIGAPVPERIEQWIKKRTQRSEPAVVPDSEANEFDSPGAGVTGDGRPGTSTDESVGEPADKPTDEPADESAGDAIGENVPPTEPQPEPDRDKARDDRVARMHAGLTELDRWLDDRIRTGLADPSLARYATWDQLAARLVDAQAGSLANRIRRLAGLVGATPGLA